MARIVYVESANQSIAEAPSKFPGFPEAYAAMQVLFDKGVTAFGQVLADDGLVHGTCVPGKTLHAKN